MLFGDPNTHPAFERKNQANKKIYRRQNDFNDLHKQDAADTKYENERKNVKGKNIE